MAQLEVHQAIESRQILKLSVEDSEGFVDALRNPPKPNDALKAAALRYERAMSRVTAQPHTQPRSPNW